MADDKYKQIWEKAITLYHEDCEKNGEIMSYEFQVIKDEGCKYSDSCLNCSLPYCKRHKEKGSY